MTKPDILRTCVTCGTSFPRVFRLQKHCSIKCRLLSEVAISTDTECWEWVGSKHYFGYGEFSWNGKYYRSHRVSYCVFRGPIPSGMQINHTCDNPSCVNPNHLYCGDQSDNCRDASQRERSGVAKLTKADIPLIRDLLSKGVPQTKVASLFHISQPVISEIKLKKIWRHVP